MLLIDVEDRKKAEQLMVLAKSMGLDFTYGTGGALCRVATMSEELDRYILNNGEHPKYAAMAPYEKDDFAVYLAEQFSNNSKNWYINNQEEELIEEFIADELDYHVEAFLSEGIYKPSVTHVDVPDADNTPSEWLVCFDKPVVNVDIIGGVVFNPDNTINYDESHWLDNQEFEVYAGRAFGTKQEALEKISAEKNMPVEFLTAYELKS